MLREETVVNYSIRISVIGQMFHTAVKDMMDLDNIGKSDNRFHFQ